MADDGVQPGPRRRLALPRRAGQPGLQRGPTLRDIAAEIGVHLSTVSRALDPRTRHLITSDLAERIQTAAQAMQYRPNSIAYSLRTRRSRMIGVLVPDITNPIFPPTVRGLEDVLAPQHYVTLVVNTDNDPAKASEAVAMLRGRGVDGLVIACATRQDPMIDLLLRDGLPVIAVNRLAEHADLSGVVHDEAGGIAALVDHLVAIGHRRIAHIAGPAALSTGAMRLAVFEGQIDRHQMSVDPAMIVQANFYSEAEGRRCAAALLRLPRRPTAIVAGNDLLALGAMMELREHGLRCPQDVSVTGYNDMAFVDRLSPPLTTVRIDTYEAGRRAAGMVLQQIESEATPPRQIETLPVCLVLRGSTAAPPDSDDAPDHEKQNSNRSETP
jgi:LacI family transcriptional regulator